MITAQTNGFVRYYRIRSSAPWAPPSRVGVPCSRISLAPSHVTLTRRRGQPQQVVGSPSVKRREPIPVQRNVLETSNSRFRPVFPLEGRRCHPRLAIGNAMTAGLVSESQKDLLKWVRLRKADWSSGPEYAEPSDLHLESALFSSVAPTEARCQHHTPHVPTWPQALNPKSALVPKEYSTPPAAICEPYQR